MNARIMSAFVVGAASAALLTLGAGPKARAQGRAAPCWIRGTASEASRRPSPLDSSSVALAGGTIKVCYGRPGRHGRVVMGQLVPYGEAWRLGANEATSIRVSFPARIGGMDVEPGSYSLYAIPDATKWRIVVNSEVQRWGVPINDEVRTRDLGSVVVPAEHLDKPVDMLTITLRKQSSSAATMEVEWENTRVRIPIERR